MRSGLVLACGLACLCTPVSAMGDSGRDVILSGVVRDAQTGDPLHGANIFIEALQAGTASGSNGTYRLELPPGSYEIRYSFVGYETEVRTIELTRNRIVDVALTPLFELDEVVVTGEPRAVDSAEMGITTMDVRELERMPALLGEVDVTRALVMLPGVTSVGEGSGSFNVRGGDADQNLVLLDGTQVFYTSHMFGMFSAFNHDLLEDVTLHRGGAPARFGGRISSVVDIRQRSGRADRFGVRGSAGIISSRLAVEGPLIGESLTAIVGGRLAYANWLLGLVDDASARQSRADFGDVGGRIAFRPTQRLQGHLSGYLSADQFRFGADTTYHYHTRNAALRLSYGLARTASVVLDATISTYAFGIVSDEVQRGFSLDARTEHYQVQPRLIWSPRFGTIEAGLGIGRYVLNPGTLVPVDEEVFSRIDLEAERAVEGIGFVSADVERGRFRIEAGLRYAHWATLGPASSPVIDPLVPRGPASVVDTVDVPAGEVVAGYGGLEPRLSVRYALSGSSSVKAGVSRMRQNVHLLSNTTAPTPVDRWKLSDANIRPQIGDQVSVGFYTEVGEGFTAALETYYRWLRDVPAYRPGAALLLSPLVAAELLDGEGRAYGAELLVERHRGSITGSLSYTLARAERRAHAAHFRDEVNFGEFYPADFDRPHDLAVAVAYHESAWATWGINFVYSSGRPITVPTGVYDLGEATLPSYSHRNQGRIPAYHRLDVSLTVNAPAVPTGRYRGRWTFAVYNLYARRNAYSVFFGQQPGTRLPQAYRLATIGTAVPSITYTFEF